METATERAMDWATIEHYRARFLDDPLRNVANDPDYLKRRGTLLLHREPEPADPRLMVNSHRPQCILGADAPPRKPWYRRLFHR